jgi:predicted O-methyltransferase YrrM
MNAAGVHEGLVRLARHSVVLRLAVYAREVLKLRRTRADAPPLRELLRQFPGWQRTLKSRASPLRDQTPWVTYGAIRFFLEQLRPDMRVFEYGAGGSTLFLARRVAGGASVEHDPAWAAEVRATLAAEGLTNWRVDLIEPERDRPGRDPSDPDAYASSDPLYPDGSFRAYAAAIDRFPDGTFDLVVIDGRARPSCFRHACSKVKTGGWLLLDNAERSTYWQIHAALEKMGWAKQSFAGPTPYTFNFSETCVWRRDG